MNIKALVGGLLGVGVVATTGTVTARSAPGSSGARETITAHVGDTITPRFSILTDSILRVSGTSIVVRACGTSRIFLRTWQRAAPLTADTVTVTVPCASPYVDTVTATVSIYGAITRGANGALLIDSTSFKSLKVGDTLSTCLSVVARNAAGQVLTGKPAHLISLDTTVIRLVGQAACPDTTVDPSLIH